MAYLREVIVARQSLQRQQWYAMRHCLRKGRYLFKHGTHDLAGRDSQYYIKEALHLVTRLRVSGSKVLW